MNTMMAKILSAVAPKLTQWTMQTATRYFAYMMFAPSKEEDIRVDLPEFESIEDMLFGADTTMEQSLMIQRLLKAEQLFKQGQSDEAREILRTSITDSQCSRCRRGIEEIIADTKTAPQKLKILRDLIPAYYQVIEDEMKLKAVDGGVGAVDITRQIAQVCKDDPDCLVYAAKLRADAPLTPPTVFIRKVGDFTQLKQKPANNKKGCSTCDTAKILEQCKFDATCIKAITAWLKDQKAKGVSVTEGQLLMKANEFRSA